LIAGGIGTNSGFTRLYMNDGLGNFEAANNLFEPINGGSIAFADIDGDNDLDVLIVGVNSSFDRSVLLYINDGMGNFNEANDTPFMGVGGAVGFADVNGDGDQDALIIGSNNTGAPTAVLYTNDGTGIFSRVGIPFEDVHSGSIAFADIDGDGDEDVLVTGDNNSTIPIAKLYKNNGIGVFSEVKNTPFEGLWWGSVAFADVDGDDDLDALLAGHITHDPSSVVTKLYLNDGVGNFTIVPDTSFEGVTESSIAFADIDSDGDLDVLLAGRNDSYDESTKLYTNDGMGNFSEVANTPFQAVRYSSIAFADIDGDNDQDVLITGEYSFDDYTKLYLNDGAGNFSETFTSMQAVSYGSVAFADVDGDNDQDVLITGRFGTNEVAKLYTNNGSGNFTEVSDTPFYAVYRSSIDFADVDDDGDQDVLIVGGEGFSDSVAKLYINDGTGNFSEASDEPFRGVERASMAFADIDNDGSLDVMITGNDYSDIVTSLYRNTTEVVSNESPIPLEHQIVRVYPNPSTNGVCNIEYSSDSNTKLLINVFDAMGKLVLYQSAVAKSGLNNFQLDFTVLNKGIYIIQMKDEKGVSTLKLINQ